MDINNNQQTNTFVKGMNSDISDAMISSDTYRYAENLRLTTNKDSNSGELRLVDGTSPIHSGDWEEIVAMTSIRDILVVVGTRKEGQRTVFNIFQMNMSTEADNASYGIWQQVFSEWLPYESDYMSIVGRWESDKNIKLYIADGKNPIMSVQLNRVQQNPITEVKDITPQETWLLRPLQVNISSASGALKPAKVQYAYILFNTGTAATKLSPLSKSVSLYDTDTKGYGIKDDIVSDKAVDIIIPAEEHPELDSIRIYRITYFQSGQTPIIEICYQGFRSAFPGIDTGNTISRVSLEEFISNNTLSIVPREIESKGNYLFAGNLSYIQDTVDAQFKEVDCTAQAAGASKAFDVKAGYKYNIEDWYIPGTTTIGGVGQHFQWELIYQDINITIKNETNSDTRSLRRGEIYRYAVILYNEDGQPSSPKWVADIWVPPADAEGEKWQVFQDRTLDMYTLRKIGVKFSLINPIEGCTAWQIVCANRTDQDKINILQGIIGLPHQAHYIREDDIVTAIANLVDPQTQQYVYNSTITPNGFMSMTPVCFINPWGFVDYNPFLSILSSSQDFSSRFSGYVNAPTTQMMFACPEYCYLADYTKQMLSGKSLSVNPILMYNTPPNSIKLRTLKYSSAKPFGYTNNDSYKVIRYIAPTTFDLQQIKDRQYNMSKGRVIFINQNHIVASSIYNKTTTDIYPNTDVQVSACSYPPVPDWNSFANGDTIRFIDDVTFIGNSQQFLNWVCGMMPYYASGDLFGDVAKDHLKRDLGEDDEYDIGTHWTPSDKMKGLRDVIYFCPIFYPVSTGGKCIVLSTTDDFGCFLYGGDSDTVDTHITVANLTNKSVIPYGGFNKTSFERSTFFANGHIKIQNGGYIDVYSGDTYLSIFTYNASHAWYDKEYTNLQRMVTIYSVPIESNINIRAAFGDTYVLSSADSKMKAFIQDDPVAIKTEYVDYVQENSAYLYNAAYSQSESVISYNPLYYSSISSNIYDTRIVYSNLKKNGEEIDNWLTFQTDNFHDVDSRFGAITDMRLFKDKFIFWQEHATGMLDVNEQAIVQAKNGSDIILGTGGLADRHDYITTKYGMRKYQHAEIQSDKALYWWDSRNKEILQLGSSLTPLTVTHGLENYINSREEATHPMLAYDIDYGEVIANVRTGGAVVYKEPGDVFTSVYTFNPVYSAVVNGDLYLASNTNVYKWNAEDRKESVLFTQNAYPKLQYTVNQNSQYNKTFDIQTFGGRFYGGGTHGTGYYNDNTALQPLQFSYKTPLKQEGSIDGLSVSNREYDFRLNIPRDKQTPSWNVPYGGRLRGKTMQCELSSTSNSTDFSLQYITTKYRMSWS